MKPRKVTEYGKKMQMTFYIVIRREFCGIELDYGTIYKIIG